MAILARHMLKQNIRIKNALAKNPDCHVSKDVKGKNVMANNTPATAKKPMI